MEILNICVLIGFFITLCLILVSQLRFKRRQSCVINFEHYMGVLTYYLDKAYAIVYKDKILVYSVEGTRPSEDDFNKATKEFCNIVLRLLGSEMLKEFYFIYGSEDNFIFSIAEYFHSKSEEDEIREQATNNLMERELK